MAKNTSYKSLLDCWAPTVFSHVSEADPYPTPIAFISTTFTFDAEFFDEECLTRFLVMETEKENDGVAFLIEREEKLAGLHGGIVLVDQMNCRGERSLRWDLVSCRVKRGVMHAKITVLHWSNCIRLIIGSANLTQTGCCINQEVFGVIDYLPNGEADLAIISGALSQLKTIIDEQTGEVVKKRFYNLQAEIKSTLRKWGIESKDYKRDEISVHLLSVGPKQSDALKRLKELFSQYSSSPAHTVYVTSPFFDEKEDEHTPSLQVSDLLRKNGQAQIYYNVTTEHESINSDTKIINAPAFLQNLVRRNITVKFEGIDELGFNEKNDRVPRPLHQKTIWLCNEDIHLYMIGSSNFTSRALGLGNFINYEANLIYIVSKSRNPKGYNRLSESYITTYELDVSELKFRARRNEDEDPAGSEFALLPSFFGEAVFREAGGHYMLELNFNKALVPKGFNVYVNQKDIIGQMVLVYNEVQFTLNERKLKVSIDWNLPKPPDFLLVRSDEINGEAFWPVVVESQITLPPVEALRNLPLEVLLRILSSNQPLHRLMKTIEKYGRSGKEGVTEVVDPHKLVNTTGFLLQRTRRVANGMRALRERLEKPVFTKESLKWRLYGPIGLDSLVEAIKHESKSDDEKLFLLAELALELSRIRPRVTEFSLKAKDVMTAVKEALLSFKLDNSLGDTRIIKSIQIYSEKAIQKALYEL